MTYSQKNFLLGVLVIFGIILSLGALAQGEAAAGSVVVKPPWGLDQFQTLLKRMLQFLFVLAIFIAVATIVMSGYYFVLGANIDPNAIQKGKDMIKYALFGLLIILAAEAIGWFVYYMLTTGKAPPPGTSL